jgi:hypothetical protein
MKWYQHLFGRDQTEAYAKGAATKGAGKPGKGAPKETKPAPKAEKNQTATPAELLRRQSEYSNQELINMRIRTTELKRIQEAYDAGTLKGKLTKFAKSDTGKLVGGVAVQFAGAQVAAKTKNQTASALATMVSQAAATKQGKNAPDVASLISAMKKPTPDEIVSAQLKASIDDAMARKQRVSDVVLQNKLEEDIQELMREARAYESGTHDAYAEELRQRRRRN